MQQRVFISAVVGALLLAGAGSFLWNQFATLDRKVGGLTAQVGELTQQVEVAEKRAQAAEERANLAEQQTAAAREQAQTASLEAETANTQAAQADRRATEAEEQALQSDLSRVAADKARLAAEEKSEQADFEAEKARSEARLAREEAEEARRRQRQEIERLNKALEQIVETTRTPLGIVMNLSSDRIEFDFDKDELRPENRELLSRIVGVLLTADHFSLQVFGHTDDVGSEEYNQGLSLRRAETVRDYLVHAGLNPDIISTRGFGKSKPLVEGTDPEARQRNRRVEIAFVQAEIDYGRAVP